MNSKDYFTLQAIPALSKGNTVGVERGSSFRGDGYISPGADDTRVQAYGRGAIPEIDCSVAAEDADWRPADEYADTYQQSISSPPFKGLPEHNVQPQAFEDGKEIPHKETPADVAATAGSFHLDTDEAPWVLYYHPSGSTDPRTDGKLVEYAYTPLGVNLSGNGLSAKRGVIEGLKVRRPLSHRGCVSPGVGGAIKKCLLYQGGKHHTVHPGGLIEDTVFAGSTINRNALFSSAISWFQGKGVTETFSATVRRTIFRSMWASPSLTHGSDFSETVITGGVFYDVQRAGYWPGETLTMKGGYLYDAGSIPAIKSGTGHTYDGLMIDGLGGGRAGRMMRKGFTMRDSVVLDQIITQSPESGETIHLENCVLIDSVIKDRQDNNPTLRLNNCIVAALHDSVTVGDFPIDPASDHCVFVTGSNEVETFLNGRHRSLSQLQNDTGAFANSAFLTVQQWRDFFRNWRRGDVRLTSEATVTHSDGTVRATMPDGTPLAEIGPRTHWEPGANKLVNGRPTQWPTPPLDESDDEAFIAEEWDWFQEPEDHTSTASLEDLLVSYWAMDGDAGTIEPDLVGANDMTTVGGQPGSGKTATFDFRTFNGEDDYLQIDSPDNQLWDPFRFWLAFSLRTTVLAAEGTVILSGMNPAGYVVKVGEGMTIEMGMKHGRVGRKETEIGAVESEFQVVQLWSDPARAQIGFRVGGTERVVASGYGFPLKTTKGRSLSLGSNTNGGWYFEGDIGPLMIADHAPTQADRDWLQNEGAFRSLSAIRNREVRRLDI
mgnify:CR=1 FL=1